jgi:WD40 repeat protein
LITTLNGHTDYVRCLAIIPSNKNIVSGSRDGLIKVWQYSKTDDKILDLIFLNNIHLATLYQNGSIIVWNIYTSEIVTSIISQNKISNHFAFDYSYTTGHLICSYDKTIKVLNTGLLYSNVKTIN